MIESQAAKDESAGACQAQVGAGWLALAASPVFALMGLVAGFDAPRPAFCASGSGILPIDDMTAMYLLMSLFHLAPWLKLASRSRVRS
ncbi:hypothetical protein [Sphingosinicella sp. CPCC 101087]|uniref:hypothetical protein n=1 Tax=Sphingosinicella sp. CPCC 101087 TaxID=2497754 RepID=UPI00101D11E4|nr:hypothetical protein [Sphingosinicella sp. CPCC 101087]